FKFPLLQLSTRRIVSERYGERVPASEVQRSPVSSPTLRVLKQSRRCWPHLLGITGLSLLALPFTLLYPLPLKIAVDSVLGKQPLQELLRWLSHPPTSAAWSLSVDILLLLDIAVSFTLLAL